MDFPSWLSPVFLPFSYCTVIMHSLCLTKYWYACFFSHRDKSTLHSSCSQLHGWDWFQEMMGKWSMPTLIVLHLPHFWVPPPMLSHQALHAQIHLRFLWCQSKLKLPVSPYITYWAVFLVICMLTEFFRKIDSLWPMVSRLLIWNEWLSQLWMAHWLFCFTL